MTTISLRRLPTMPSPVPVPEETILGWGEIGFEDATGILRIGDGKTVWKNLPNADSPLSGVLSHYGTSAPVAGTWLRGSIIWNTEPVAGENIGWVCTVAGTPGTWCPFGVIST